MKSIGRVLASMSLVGLLMAGLILLGSLWGFRTAGEAADQTFVGKDVVADILPPPLYLLEMRMVLSQVAEGSLKAAEAKGEIERLESEYEFWRQNPPYGLEKQLMGAQHEAAQKFIISARDVLQVVSAGDAAKTSASLTNAHALYVAHRTAVADTVKAAMTFAEGTMGTFRFTMKEAVVGQLAVFAIAVVVLGFLGVWINKRVTRPIHQAARVAETVATGDLTTKFHIQYNDETGQLLGALQGMNQNLQGMVQEVRDGCNAIANGSSEIASGNTDLSQRTEAQAATLEETAASMEQLNDTVKNNAANARQASQMAVAYSGDRDR